MLFPQKINVVASARHANPHNETVVVQNDTAVEFYVAVVGDNGQTELPEGATYTLVCLHLRKQPTEKLGTLQADGNVMFKLTHMELSETGPVQGQVRVYHPVGGRLTSNPFIFHVAPDPTYGAEIKPEDQSIIEQVIGEGPAIIAEAKEETTKNITERARLTGAVGDALDSLDQDKADALLEMSQSKTAADESAQTALQAADNADQERNRLTQEVTDKITEVESARTATVEATGEALDAADLATQEAEAARLQKQEVEDILGAGPVASVNGKTGVVDGLATQESMNQVTAQLAETDAEAKRKREPEDLSERTLELVTGGTVNLLTIPQDKSVTPEKTTFIKKGDNLFDPSTSKEGRLSSSGGESTESGYVITNFVSVSPGDSVYYYFDDGQTVFNVRTFLYDIEFNLIEVLSDYKSGDVLSNPNVRYIRTSVGMSTATNKFGINLNSLKPHEPYHVRFENMKILKDDIVGLEDYETLPDGVVSRYKLDEGLQQSITLPEQELTNIMLNGDFSDGVTGWAATRDGAIPTVSANVLTSEMVSTSIKGNWQLFQTNPNIVVGRKYYFAVDIKPAKNTTVSLAIKEIIKPFVNMTENTWNRVSEIMHITSAPEALNRITAYIDTNSFVPGEKISFRNFNVIDLTASYGEGNEPTKEFMDYLLKDRGYVSGTSNVTIVDEIPKLVGAFDAQIKPQDARKFTSHLYGKEMVCFGDSITGNHFINDYPSIIAKRTGMKVHNVGFGGTRIGYHEQADYDKFSFYRLVDTVISGDYSTLKQPFVNGRPTPYDARVAILEKINWNNVKYISIAYMANDWGANSPNEGATNEDVTSVKGAGRLALRKLLTAYPHLKVLIVSPFYRYFPQENPVTDSDDTPRGIQNWYMREYVEAAKELADEFHFPFVNVYNGLGINKYTRGQYFDGSDGTHHDERGRIHIGNKLASKILSEY